MSLRNVQAMMKDALLRDDAPAAMDGMFAEGSIPVPARMKVYKNNILGSLTTIMADTFPAVRKLVGKEFFNSMVRRFISQHPPLNGYLLHYGTGFDDFIRGYEPAKNLPYLADVAAYEIALNDAYYAADDAALTATALTRVTPNALPDVNLSLRRSVAFVQSNYPLTLIQEFCKAPEGKLDIRTGGEKLMISRPHLEVMTTHLDDTEWDILNAMKDAGSMTLEAIIQRYPGLDFERFLQKHLECGTFRAVSVL